jgi:hypothetical protein
VTSLGPRPSFALAKLATTLSLFILRLQGNTHSKMYRSAVASLRLAAPRRTIYATPAARKDINHKVGDTLAAGESFIRSFLRRSRGSGAVILVPADPDHDRDAEVLISQAGMKRNTLWPSEKPFLTVPVS